MSRARAPGRILMTTDTVGGVFDYVVELSRRLSCQGVEVLVATMGAPLTPAQAEMLFAIPRLKIFESRFKLEWMDEPWSDVDEAGEWLLEIENSTRPDLVHLNGYAHGSLPWRAPCVVVAHSCVLSWWRAVRREPLPERLDMYRRRVRRGLSHAAMVVAPSAAMLQSLRDIYGPFQHERVIYNGRDAREFAAGDKDPIVVSMGRCWDEAKNIALLDEAAASLRWPVLVAGSAGLDEATGAAGARRPTHAQYIGRLEPQAVKALLARTAIYVHPARYEPFGLAILEAALAGSALVLGDIPSLREIWKDAAVFVPVDDAAQLACELAALIEDGARRRVMAARAQRMARRYTPERMISAYLAVYGRMMSASHAYRDEEISPCT